MVDALEEEVRSWARRYVLPQAIGEGLVRPRTRLGDRPVDDAPGRATCQVILITSTQISAGGDF
jgi:hypothetical protein